MFLWDCAVSCVFVRKCVDRRTENPHPHSSPVWYFETSWWLFGIIFAWPHWYNISLECSSMISSCRTSLVGFLFTSASATDVVNDVFNDLHISSSAYLWMEYRTRSRRLQSNAFSSLHIPVSVLTNRSCLYRLSRMDSQMCFINDVWFHWRNHLQMVYDQAHIMNNMHSIFVVYFGGNLW